jgi:hypothetical protein
LETFKTQLLEETNVVQYWASPLEVVIALVEGIACAPPATLDAIVALAYATARDVG